ncbi:MAG: glycosyltransferase family 4 protein, partial [Pseudomonadota bacterium]
MNIVDVPLNRSNHQNITPRGGGIAIFASIIIIYTAFIFLYSKNLYDLLPIICLVPILIISFIDDIKNINFIARVAVQLISVSAGIYIIYFSPENSLLSLFSHLLDTDSQLLVGDNYVLPRLFPNFIPLYLELLLIGIGWIWFINLYNFMDGIDGITVTQTITIAIGIIAMTLIASYDSKYIYLSLAIIGAILGFAIYNWHPAKIFMGDIGSVSLGYLLGFLLIELSLNGSYLAIILFLSYYLSDSGITITKRLIAGKKIWQAHSEHFYQQAARNRQ